MAWALRRVEPLPPANDRVSRTDPDYQETMVFTPETMAAEAGRKKRRWILPTLFLLLLATAAGIFYYIQPSSEDKPGVIRVPIASDRDSGNTHNRTAGSAPKTAAPSRPTVDPQVAQWLKDAQDNLNRTQKALADARDRLKLVLAIPLELAVRVTAPPNSATLQLSSSNLMLWRKSSEDATLS